MQPDYFNLSCYKDGEKVGKGRERGGESHFAMEFAQGALKSRLFSQRKFMRRLTNTTDHC